MTTGHSPNASAAPNRTHRRPEMTSKYLLIALTLLAFTVGQTTQPRKAAADELETLAAKQQSVTKRYERLEELLLRLAEVEATENPERSALLRRAAKQSRDKFVLEKLKLASASLKTQEFQKAVENQEAATKELGDLLKLLLRRVRNRLNLPRLVTTGNLRPMCLCRPVAITTFLCIIP